MAYLHGIEIKEGAKRNILTTGDTSIIAIVGTAPKGAVNTVKLITSLDQAKAEFGDDISGFTIPQTLETIFSYVSSKVLVVNVLDTETASSLLDADGKMTRDANDNVATNIYKTTLPELVDYTSLIVAGVEMLTQVDDSLGVKPNIVIAPGYSQLQPVFNKLSEVATKIQGFTAIDIVANDVPLALTARVSGVFNTSSQAVVLCYPQVERFNAHEGINDIVGLSAHWAACKALRDAQSGYWLSPSNSELVGCSGLTSKISSSLTDSSADTNLLNGEGIVTVFRKSGSGSRLWGNWTAGFPSSKTTENMIAARAVRMAIREALVDASLEYLDRNATSITIEMVQEDVNSYIRTLVGQGALVAGECLFEADKNPSTEIAQGKLTFCIYITFAASTERITFEENIEIGE